VRDRSQALVEKYQLSGMGLATLERGTLGLATMDALHFKTMALDRNFERVRVTALFFVRGAVSLQVVSAIADGFRADWEPDAIFKQLESPVCSRPLVYILIT
jgi:hypothetical protein